MNLSDKENRKGPSLQQERPSAEPEAATKVSTRVCFEHGTRHRRKNAMMNKECELKKIHKSRLDPPDDIMSGGGAHERYVIN